MRDALVIEAFKEPRYFAPVLALVVHALPHTLCDVDAHTGACVQLVIGGPAGGRWIAQRTFSAWGLGPDQGGPATATVTIDQDMAWQMYTKGISRDTAMAHVSTEGDRLLGA